MINIDRNIKNFFPSKGKNIFLIVSCALFLIAGCKKDNNSSKPPTTGDLVLSSEKIPYGQSYAVKGYSLSQGKYIDYLAGAGTGNPDWVLSEIIDAQSNPIGTDIQSPGNSNAFFKIGSFDNAIDAETAFNSLLEVTSSQFSATAPDVKANEVYVYKSLAGNYAKFWVKSVQIISQTVSVPYVQVTLGWEYQPDGTNKFPAPGSSD